MTNIMINQNLLDYINNQLQRGVSESEIRQSLLNNGWLPDDVETAFNSRFKPPQSTAPQTPSPLSREEAVAAVKKMGRFKASWTLFKQSLHILQQDKEVVLFPILSSIIMMFVGGLFIGGLFLTGAFEAEGETTEIRNQALFYSGLFIYYVISYFILTYFKVGLTAVVYERINGRDINFKTGMNHARKIAGKIFVWSFIAGTVGIVLRIISDKSKLLGKIATSLLGAAWSIVTMFIAPTLLLDNVSVWQSIKNSGSVFKKTWGETLIMNISIGLVTFIAIFGTMFLFIVLAIASAALGLGPIGLILIFILLLFSLIAISVISTSLSEIFKVALYSFARFGIIAEGFSPELIVGAVKEGKK
jgi:Family of unknown function (DUF6159)